MATLVSGQQYGLSSKSDSTDHKSLVFLKLTDSALRTIEEFARNASYSNQRPTIQFLKSQGIMVIPRVDNSPTKFGFNISNYPESDGSFDCLQQSGSRSLVSLGSMLHKMQIHAKEDSYEIARHRVAEVEQQSKNNGTKVIKASGHNVGRKVKVKQPLSTIPPRPVSTSPLSYHNNVLGNFATSQSQYNPVLKSSSLPINKMNVNKPNRPTSDIMKRSYRERVIQLLALKPYKKPELLVRLMKDGVKEKDKKSLTSILSQVAVLKDNTYDLARHMWNEVNEEWPFYTESDKKLLKRRKPQNLTPPGENMNPETNQLSMSSPASMKRPFENEGNPVKKQRISHYQKANDAKQSKPEVLKKTDNVLQSSSYKLNYEKRSGFKKEKTTNSVPTLFKSDYESNSLPYDSSSNSPFSSNRSNTYLEDSKRSLPRSGNSLSAFKNLHSNSKKVNSTGSSPSSSPDSVDSNDSGFTGFQKYSDDHDFMNKYHAIKNTAQRAEYKTDFNSEYEEYKTLYKKITDVSKIFTTLGENLKSVPEGSQEYNRIKSQIVQEYNDGKYRKQYQEAKRRFQYLHDKLAHIKRLIVTFDQGRSSL